MTEDAARVASGRRRGWRLVLHVAWGQRRGILAGIMFGFVWAAAKVTVPRLTQRAIDHAIVTQQESLLLLVLLVLLAGVVSGVCLGLRRYQSFGIAWRAETELRQRLFAHLQRLHFAYHDRAQTGELMARAATDAQQIRGFASLLPITISNIVTMIAVTAILLTMNWKLAIAALVALPLINVFAKRFSNQVHPASMSLQRELSEYSGVVEETLSGIRVVKGFGAEQIQYDALHERSQQIYERGMNLSRVRARFNPLIEFLPAVGLIAVLWYGGHEVLAGRLTIGELVAFNVYVVLLIPAMRMTGMVIASAQRAVASGERIDLVLRAEPEIVDRDEVVPLPPGGGEVRFENVTFAYGEQPVLRNFDLHVRAGEAVAIVGATGSGKTTIARLIPRFYDASGGRILLDGVDIRDLAVVELRKSIGIVFEDTFLFSQTIRENIAFADPYAPPEMVERAARLAGAHDFIVEMPDGYETIIGEQGFSLSGGQRQRVALARAILSDPRVLILDDATSSVDATKEHEIRDALAEVMRGRTTIVIAHRPATIALADRVVLIDDGKVVAEGTHERLLETSERYRHVLAQQAAARDDAHATEAQNP